MSAINLDTNAGGSRVLAEVVRNLQGVDHRISADLTTGYRLLDRPEDGKRPILLKNSLSGEKGGRVENVGLHNRATFNDLDSGKESPYPEKISFRVFQQNRP